MVAKVARWNCSGHTLETADDPIYDMDRFSKEEWVRRG
jgi:hypothetical protein